MSHLPVHGRDAHLIANIVITLLDDDDREYDAFTPVTMSLPEESGIEPDYKPRVAIFLTSICQTRSA
jgi:Uma2 family endonuclease